MSVELGPGASALGGAGGSPAINPSMNANMGRRITVLEEEFFQTIPAGDLDNQPGMGGNSWQKLVVGGELSSEDVDATSKLDGTNSVTNIFGGAVGIVIEQKALKIAGGPVDEVVYTFRVLAQATMLPLAGASVSSAFIVDTADILYPTNAAAVAAANDVLDVGIGRTAGGNVAIQFFDKENPGGTAFFDTGVALGTALTIGLHVLPSGVYMAYAVTGATLTPTVIVTNPPATIGPVGDHVDVNGTGHTAMVSYNIAYQAALLPVQPSNAFYCDTFRFYKVPSPAAQSNVFFDGEVSTSVPTAGFGTVGVQVQGTPFTATSSVVVQGSIDGVVWITTATIVGNAGMANAARIDSRGVLALRFIVSLPTDTGMLGVTILLAAI